MTLLKQAGLVLFGFYAWLSFLVFGGATLILLILLPGLNLRRSVGAAGARIWLASVGIRIECVGMSALPTTPSVIVANHSSYIDGVLLKAILPARFAFVIKKEMVRVPIAGLLLRRIGAEFVDRFNRHSGAMDARRLMRKASKGSSLVFFPEGTFSDRTGVGRFHGGAFVIAARSTMTVVPLAIQGARGVLPANSLLPRPGRVRIAVLPAITAPEALSAHSLANHLRDQSRSAILQELKEPDLADDDGVAALATVRAKA